MGTVSWFERLKEIIKIEIKFDSLIKVQIKHNDFSNRIDYDEETGILTLNNKKFSFVEKNQIKDSLKRAHNENIPLLSEKTQERINDIKLKEQEPDVKPTLDFFRDKIPVDDYTALRAAIYIDKLAREGLGYKEVYRLKGEIANRFGPRGYKICNLYALGYFETVIKPLYEEFSQQEFFDRKKFLHKYNIIINEEAFAVFVPDTIEKDELIDAIKIKIMRNLKYGRRDVTIHAKGRYNVDKVRGAISDIEEEGEYPIEDFD